MKESYLMNKLSYFGELFILKDKIDILCKCPYRAPQAYGEYLKDWFTPSFKYYLRLFLHIKPIDYETFKKENNFGTNY